MTLLPIDQKEIPRTWRKVFTLFGLLGLGASLGYGADLAVRHIAHKEGKDAATEFVQANLDSYKALVLQAAMDAAAQAVGSKLNPVGDRLTGVEARLERFGERLGAVESKEAQHESKDDQRQVDTEKRIDRLERDQWRHP